MATIGERLGAASLRAAADKAERERLTHAVVAGVRRRVRDANPMVTPRALEQLGRYVAEAMGDELKRGGS